MIIVILPILSILQIVGLGDMIVEINITRVTILIITMTINTIAISYGEESIIFVVKKVVTLISIQIINNRR